jgi:hypothetical protein
MHLVTTRDATRLTGLSTEQLREWTSRRALIPPDVKPKGHGSPARYSWQTILLLRLAVVLRDRFRLELQAHRDLFSDLAAGLARVSFLSLGGQALILYGGMKWSLADVRDGGLAAGDCIVLQLDSHLQQLSEGFSLPDPVTPLQVQLFPTLGMTVDGAATGATRRRKHG